MQWVCGAGRVLACRIVLLDEREQLHEIQANKSGQLLLDAVFRQLDLVETSYFGLRYLDQDNQPRWLEPRRRLSRQLRGNGPHTLYLAVKFYAADPCRLLEEITRYQVFLQVRQDVVRGRLPVPPDLAPQLGAYVLQSELGDYDPRRHPAGYVSEFRLQPGQTTALEARAAELHRTLAGQSPAAAELGYLDRSKWLELYGADLHPVLGEDSVEYFLGLAPSGVLVLRNKRAVASYYWPRITKLYSKGKYFMLRVTDKNNEVSTYGFETPSRGACRHLWHCCSEQHAFFRLQPAPQQNRSVRQSGRSPPAFTRVPSRRLMRRNLDSNQISTIEVRDSQDLKPISIPQPALSLESPYRSTCSIPAALGSMRRSDSPRSTRSAPFPRPPPRQGLYSGPPSPRAAGAPSQTSNRLRSSSIDSHSSNDSRSCRRHRQRSRRTSDAESEVSRGSGRSRRRRRHRSRHKGKDSADETDSKHRSSSRRKEYELVESGGQWKEAQRKQAAAAGAGAVQQASVRRAATSTEPADPSQAQHRSSHRHRRHRKHRSRSRSPSESKSWLPTELKQHLEWELVDTEGMSADQLREIPYTVVQTSRARQLRLKSGKHRSGENPNDNEDPTKNYSKNSNMADIMNCNGGSIRSVSSTISSGRNSNSKTSERRLKDLTCKDMSPSVGGGLTSRGSRAAAGPETAGGTRPVASASNSSSGELIASARVSHEHTDSGLGADQDYAYSSERSSDSAKCPMTGGPRQQPALTPSVSSHHLRPGAPYSHPPPPTPHSLSADLAALSLTRRKPPINPAVNKHSVQPSNIPGMSGSAWGAGGRGRSGGSLRSLASVASVQSEGRATLNKHRGPLYFVRGDASYAYNRHASNNNFVDSGIFLTSHRQNGGSLRSSTSYHADFYNMNNRSNNPGHSTLNRYMDANANVKRHGGHATDNSLQIILKPLIESTQLQGN